MNYLIEVDLEGAACAVGAPGGRINDSANFEFARLQATREAAAAARGLYAAGAGRVVIWDAHSGGVNLHYELLDPRCEIALGAMYPRRCPGLDASFAGLLFVGLHAMAGTPQAVMAHTMSSREYEWIKANGREVGEMAIDAAVAGEHGVPAIFAAGDDKTAAEARRFFGDIETLATKQAIGWNAAVSKHPMRVVEEIEQAANRAANRAKEFQPFLMASPITLEIRFKRIEDAQEAAKKRPEWTLAEANTLRRVVEKLSEAF